MPKITNANPLVGLDPAKYSVPPLPKQVDTRGFIYIVLDKAFPEHFKIGKTTDMAKRLMAYNSDRPYKTVSVHMISNMFTDVDDTESRILKALYTKTPPTTFSREWFPIEFLSVAYDLVVEAENTFPLEEAWSL